MLLILGGVITFATVVLIKLRVPGGVSGANLGSMSAAWLAEQRASRPH